MIISYLHSIVHTLIDVNKKRCLCICKHLKLVLCFLIEEVVCMTHKQDYYITSQFECTYFSQHKLLDTRPSTAFDEL